MTAVNRPIVDDLVARHPWLDGRAHVLPNGFDRAEQPADVSLGDGFWIVHTGRLYGREQQVAAFLEALAAQPADVKALFVGVDESRVRPDADRLGLGDRVRVEPLVPLPVALGYQRAADALLLVNGRRPESMSSKVFEYLQAGRPIFAISPAGSAARGLFAEVGGGTCVLPDDPMTEPLAAFVAAVRGGEAPVADPGALGRYELGHLTRELAGILDGLAGSPWIADPDDREPEPNDRLTDRRLAAAGDASGRPREEPPAGRLSDASQNSAYPSPVTRRIRDRPVRMQRPVAPSAAIARRASGARRPRLVGCGHDRELRNGRGPRHARPRHTLLRRRRRADRRRRRPHRA